MRRKHLSAIQFIRKKLQGAERKYKTTHPLLAQEARIAEDIINIPSGERRFERDTPRPILDAPNELKGKRLRRFLLPTIALNIEMP